MNSLEKFDLGRPSEGSTFSATLHLLSSQMQEWIRRTPDKKQLRRFACASVRTLFPLCPHVPGPALQAVELADRFCADQASEPQLEQMYASLSPLGKELYEKFRIVQQSMELDRATLDDCLSAELAHRAVMAGRATVLRSASVAAAESVFEYSNVLTRRKAHDLHVAFLTRAGQVLDNHPPWSANEQDELLQSYLKDLPRPLTARLYRASDAALRQFACDSATTTLDFARTQLKLLTATEQLDPLVRIIETSRRHSAGQATAAELKAAYESGLKLASEWYRKEDELRERAPENTRSIQTAQIVAEAADCVYPTAESSARLAAVKCLRVAMHILRATDAQAVIHPLAVQYLGPPPLGT
jgi:hypothetical protein